MTCKIGSSVLPERWKKAGPKGFKEIQSQCSCAVLLEGRMIEMPIGLSQHLLDFPGASSASHVSSPLPHGPLPLAPVAVSITEYDRSCKGISQANGDVTSIPKKICIQCAAWKSTNTHVNTSCLGSGPSFRTPHPNCPIRRSGLQSTLVHRGFDEQSSRALEDSAVI